MPGKINGSTKPSALVVPGSEHNRSHPCLHESTSAHRTGLQGHNQGAVVEAPVTRQPSSLLKCHQFRMAEGIVTVMAAVAPMADHSSFPIKDNRRHRHFTTPARLGCTGKQDLHPASVPLIPHHALRGAHLRHNPTGREDHHSSLHDVASQLSSPAITGSAGPICLSRRQ